MYLSDLPLAASRDPGVPKTLGAQRAGRTVEVPPTIAEWADRQHLTTAGQLLAALDGAPSRAAAAWGWTEAEVVAAGEDLRRFLARSW